MVALVKNISETLSVLDERRGASRCVVSDILIGTSDMTQAQFDALVLDGAAVGYENFKIFSGGDYQYQNALFKTTMGVSNGSMPRLITLKVDVDLVDITDRGTATTSSTGVVTVTCARPFVTLSEVVATLKGGTLMAVPRVSNLRAIGLVGMFDAELINAAGARVVGDISWSAKGC